MLKIYLKKIFKSKLSISTSRLHVKAYCHEQRYGKLLNVRFIGSRVEYRVRWYFVTNMKRK